MCRLCVVRRKCEETEKENERERKWRRKNTCIPTQIAVGKNNPPKNFSPLLSKRLRKYYYIFGSKIDLSFCFHFLFFETANRFYYYYYYYYLRKLRDAQKSFYFTRMRMCVCEEERERQRAKECGRKKIHFILL